jgi:TRAP-type C4-dicarboxylate transport system substrate-binding protein
MQVLNGRRSLVLAAAAATLPAPWLARAQGTQRRWRVSTPYATSSFQTQKLQWLADRVGGLGVQIELQSGSGLNRWSDVLAALRQGTLEGAELIMSALAPQFPLAAADSVPFVVRSYAEARRMWRIQKPLLDQRLRAEGLVGLMSVPWPPQGLFCRRSIEGLSDLKGLRLRTYNKTTVRIAELLQATPVDVPTVKVSQALAEGRIDAMITSGVTGVESRAWEHLSHYYPINAWIPKNCLVVSAGALQGLDARIREAFDVAVTAVEDQAWARSEQAADEAVRTLRAEGMTTGRPSAEILRDLKRLGERFSIEWLREVGPEANHVFVPYFSQP